jgi:NitT/TauT family transport system substrate-binding protein
MSDDFPLGTLKILVPSPHIPSGYSPVLMAKSLGYAADEGLNLQVVAIGRPLMSIEGAVKGEGIAFVNMVFNFLIRDQGRPFRSFYSVARKQNRSFAVPVDSPIKDLADLKGKVIGLHYPDLLEFAYAALAGEGVEKDDVKFVPLPGSPLDEKKMVACVQANEVQAVWQIDHNYGLFAAEDFPLRQLPAPTIDRLTPCACFYANDEILKSRPEAFAALGRAVSKATVFAMENPEAVVRLLWRDIPEARPVPEDERRVMRRDLAILKHRLSLCRFEDAPDPRWGAITLPEIDRWQNFMLETDAIKNRRDPHDYFVNDFVDEYNNFSSAAVIEHARNFKVD